MHTYSTAVFFLVVPFSGNHELWELCGVGTEGRLVF